MPIPVEFQGRETSTGSWFPANPITTAWTSAASVIWPHACESASCTCHNFPRECFLKAAGEVSMELIPLPCKEALVRVELWISDQRVTSQACYRFSPSPPKLIIFGHPVDWLHAIVGGKITTGHPRSAVLDLLHSSRTSILCCSIRSHVTIRVIKDCLFQSKSHGAIIPSTTRTRIRTQHCKDVIVGPQRLIGACGDPDSLLADSNELEQPVLQNLHLLVQLSEEPQQTPP
mmetsp:Transcript_9020/g.16858  ORF Transcript_9020/g.16858 Transcript_9020/m.16858 type:complete len:231 (-) Transcript_9020:363-1055(-)